jgi:hypothetical protein
MTVSAALAVDLNASTEDALATIAKPSSEMTAVKPSSM